jgi:hypothetical protein
VARVIGGAFGRSRETENDERTGARAVSSVVQRNDGAASSDVEKGIFVTGEHENAKRMKRKQVAYAAQGSFEIVAH